jgi:hypothetical protein
MEAIRPELHALPTPRPTDSLRSRIIESRAAGLRQILPIPEEERGSVRRSVVLAAAAAVVLLLIPLGLNRSGRSTEDVVSPGVFGHMVFAQEYPPARRSGFAPIQVTKDAKLRPMSAAFERRITRDGKAAAVDHIAIDVVPAAIGNIAAWRVVNVDRHADPAGSVAADTSFVAQSDLRLLRRSIHVTPYHRYGRINVAQHFSGDSISGHMYTERPGIGAGRSFARSLPRSYAPFLTETIAPVFFMGVPITRNWSGSASLVGWAVRSDDVLIPIELRVVSEESIATPAGRFDCWRLVIRFSGRQIDYWVRKSDGLGVRVLDVAEEKTSGAREILLTRVK